MAVDYTYRVFRNSWQFQQPLKTKPLCNKQLQNTLELHETPWFLLQREVFVYGKKIKGWENVGSVLLLNASECSNFKSYIEEGLPNLGRKQGLPVWIEFVRKKPSSTFTNKPQDLCSTLYSLSFFHVSNNNSATVDRMVAVALKQVSWKNLIVLSKPNQDTLSTATSTWL